MLRYYAIATVIVVLIGATVVAQHWLRGEVKIASVQVRLSPRPDGQGESFAKSPVGGFRLESASVLSTLPDCLLQTGYFRGTRAFVDGELPTHGPAIAAGTRLHVGACTIDVRAQDIVAARGADRVRVTPRARLYPIDGGYLLDVDRGKIVEARRYRLPTAEGAR